MKTQKKKSNSNFYRIKLGAGMTILFAVLGFVSSLAELDDASS